MMRIAQRAFESMFKGVTIGYPTSVTRYYTEYKTVVSGGIKKEGEKFDKMYTSQEDAIAAWLLTAVQFNGERRPYLHWRTEPEVMQMDNGEWVVYSRLATEWKL